MNITSYICAFFFSFCSPEKDKVVFDFEYSSPYEFARGVVYCTVSYNAMLSPEDRIPWKLSLAQAALESAWGESRFAREGNNLYGIRAVDEDSFMIPRDNPSVKVKKYLTLCNSVMDYMDLLNKHNAYEKFRDLRYRHLVLQTVDIEEVVYSLTEYSRDPNYFVKILDIMAYIDEQNWKF